MERTVKLLPQPGPPVRTATFSVSASCTAALCPAASSTPVRRCSQASAASQSTLAKAASRSSSAPASLFSPPASETSARWKGTR